MLGRAVSCSVVFFSDFDFLEDEAEVLAVDVAVVAMACGQPEMVWYDEPRAEKWRWRNTRRRKMGVCGGGRRRLRNQGSKARK